MTVKIRHRETRKTILSYAGDCLYKADFYKANLSEANLSGANLYKADLSRADLSRADLSGANLYKADLYKANLSEANLYGAGFYGASLYRADLSGANLSRADLSGANLSGADLYRADLSGANLIIGAQDFRGYQWLLYYENNECIVRAGCRTYTLDNAFKYWDNDAYHNQENRPHIRSILNHLETAAYLRGWIKQTKEPN